LNRKVVEWNAAIAGSSPYVNSEHERTFSDDKAKERKMKSSISYKNCLIRSESFQRETKGSWIPQYTVTGQDAKKTSGVPSHHAQLDKTFWSENEADEFALQDAMHWIDKN
jgi:hypothetical protein